MCWQVDFPFDPIHDDDKLLDESNDASVDSPLAEDKSVAAEPAMKSMPTRSAASSSKADEEALDSLLELSVSAATAAGGRIGGGFGSSAVATAPPAATTSQAQMEEWLDDVLDI